MDSVNMLPRQRTFRAWQETFRTIYHRRNLWTSSPSRIAMQVGLELRILSRCVDRGEPMNEQALAGLGARLFALANFLDEDLAFLVATKYHGKCPYCLRLSFCGCPVSDRTKTFADTELAEEIANGWQIDETQLMLARIYGRRNADAGIRSVFDHLNGEFMELIEAIANLDVEAFREEIADVFAWWLGLVTLSNIPSASDLLHAHYPDACSRCGQPVCAITALCPPL